MSQCYKNKISKLFKSCFLTTKDINYISLTTNHYKDITI
jgi:hypothetical protein